MHYFVTGGCGHSGGRFIRKVFRERPGVRVTSLDALTGVGIRAGRDRRYAIDSGEALTELGWVPRQAFDEAIAATVEWHRGNEAWWQPLMKA